MINVNTYASAKINTKKNASAKNSVHAQTCLTLKNALNVFQNNKKY